MDAIATMFSGINAGVGSLMDVQVIALMIFGTFFGIMVGAIPGLSGTIAIALLVPITFAFPPMAGLAMLAGIYNGAIFGGSISAILLRIPGTPAAVVTIFDGYEMTRKGQSAHALELAVSSSVFGGILSALVLLFVAPPLARVALMFGPSEYFWVAIFGLTIIASLSSGSVLKGVIAGLLGILASQIGLDPLTAAPRFTFHYSSLVGGLEIISVMMGLFALPQAFMLIIEPARGKELAGQSHERAPLFGMFASLWRNYIRSSVVGTIVGIIPAAGGNIASFISYDLAKRWSRNPEKFGTGSPEGVVASEAANNAITGGSFVPLLALGIPGSTSTAAIMGAFMIHGLNLGPQLFDDNPDVVFGLILALIFTNVVMLFMGYFGSRYFSHVLRTPPQILAALIVMFCVVGSYSMRSSMFDVYTLVSFGLLGLFMERNGFPVAPLVLGLVLGPLTESNLVRALAISHGDVMGLFNSPLSLLFAALSALSLVSAFWRRRSSERETVSTTPDDGSTSTPRETE